MQEQVIVLIPLYKPALTEIERYSLDVSLQALSGRKAQFIAPESIDRAYYQANYPNISFVCFEDHYFASIEGYNRLLLAGSFYRRFELYEYILILQTDAIVLRDELDLWINKPFDYIGAPWADGNELFVNLGLFEGEYGKVIKVFVGNGGLSLRRTKKCISLLEEFPVALAVFLAAGSSEDLFFSYMGALSADFIIPNEITASLFSLELKPAYYYKVNGGRVPMGGHAWWKYDAAFWKPFLPPSALLNDF
ncbi:DUF5672 family protein [Iodobacter fluviatilis]|uniref:DUF5672 domain-containing protein n=1 Tax=Iodobacter fluviatilis TaxID=537 RepID=A0A377QD92_9NEIS|nr:DUF5672 family protein [Iodobacter fluviatilis]TCU83652.1 hypothetical protein EV682_11111 [Iodobacter fluviatilis]STQ91841.1 Uncharacterised protein [Iodobacter fluviatilis]